MHSYDLFRPCLWVLCLHIHINLNLLSTCEVQPKTGSIHGKAATTTMYSCISCAQQNAEEQLASADPAHRDYGGSQWLHPTADSWPTSVECLPLVGFVPCNSAI
jgi:hypothetical protein